MATLAREFPKASLPAILQAAALLMRHSRTHSRLAVDYCNGLIQTDDWHAIITPIRTRIQKAYASIGGKAIEFGGDPRGFTVKLVLPSNRANNMGGTAWGVPNS